MTFMPLIGLQTFKINIFPKNSLRSNILNNIFLQYDPKEVSVDKFNFLV